MWHDRHVEAARRMAPYDGQRPEVRALIQEFNIVPVMQLLNMGMSDPAKIRAVLEERQRAGDEAAKKLFRQLVSTVTKSVDRALVRPSRMRDGDRHQ